MKSLASAFVALALLGYVVMILVGAAHHGTPAIPSIGYWPAVALVLAARIAIVNVNGKATK